MGDAKITEHGYGIVIVRDGHAPIYLDLLYADTKRGSWLLLSTDHSAVEVRVSPAGRKVSAETSRLTHRKIWGDGSS